MNVGFRGLTHAVAARSVGESGLTRDFVGLRPRLHHHPPQLPRRNHENYDVFPKDVLPEKDVQSWSNVHVQSVFDALLKMSVGQKGG